LLAESSRFGLGGVMIRNATVFAVLGLAACLASPPAIAEGETGLASIHEQRREGNRICMSTHFHHGSSSGHKTRKEAEAAAARDWAGFTAWEYGLPWGSYRLAASKSMNCSQSGATWGCQVEARPCKQIPRGRR